ncbi:MAG: hypothetical protein ACKPKO_20335, partial [Candidatus Fonsibacter sp.]
MTEFNPDKFESFKMLEGSECRVPLTVAANQHAFREAVFQSKLKLVDDVGSRSCLAMMKCAVEAIKDAADVGAVHNISGRAWCLQCVCHGAQEVDQEGGR